MVEQVSIPDLVNAQKNDAVIQVVYDAVLKNARPSKKIFQCLNQKSKMLMQQFGKLSLDNSVLVRQTAKRKQIVLPAEFHEMIYKELHEKMAHLCSEKTIELAQQRFYWPYMSKDIYYYIKKRCLCVTKRKPNVPERAALIPIESSSPFEMVSIDFLHLDKANEYVLMVCDHFTRFTQAYATKNK